MCHMYILYFWNRIIKYGLLSYSSDGLPDFLHLADRSIPVAIQRSKSSGHERRLWNQEEGQASSC